MQKRSRVRACFASELRRGRRSCRFQFRGVAAAVSALLLSCALFVFAGSNAAWASGAFKRTPGTEKGAFIVQGEIIFVGSADYWDTSFDPEVDSAVNLLADYSPGTDAAREYLDNVGIDLGAVGDLQVEVSSASTSGWTTTHIVSSMAVTMGSLTFFGFGSSTLESGTGAFGPFPDAAVTAACAPYIIAAGCDWVWGEVTNPAGIEPDGTGLEFDGSVGSGGEQRGLNFHYGGDVSTLPANDGLVETTTINDPAYVMLDLDVPDLPTTWQTAYGTNVRVVFEVYSGVYYYAVYVPTMDASGGALLVLFVMAVGLLTLCCPFRVAS